MTKKPPRLRPNRAKRAAIDAERRHAILGESGARPSSGRGARLAQAGTLRKGRQASDFFPFKISYAPVCCDIISLK